MTDSFDMVLCLADCILKTRLKMEKENRAKMRDKNKSSHLLESLEVDNQNVG
jgi:hypothetical protein